MTPSASLRSLSSAQTFFMKYVFPACWIPGFGLATLGLWRGVFHGRHGALMPEPSKWVFLATWVCGSAFLFWFCGRLKRVRTDGKLLYISNYLREIAVPLKEVEDVQESPWLRGHPVTIRFYQDTGFGESVTFLPPVRFHLLPKPHPIVEELKELAGIG